jgi:hypothetical protein
MSLQFDENKLVYSPKMNFMMMMMMIMIIIIIIIIFTALSITESYKSLTRTGFKFIKKNHLRIQRKREVKSIYRSQYSLRNKT